jgi:hypothetical protein
MTWHTTTFISQELLEGYPWNAILLVSTQGLEYDVMKLPSTAQNSYWLQM